MAKPIQILFYEGISTYTAMWFINELETNAGKDICVELNCIGGSIYDSIGMINAFKSHTGSKEIFVSGMAASAAAYMLLFAKDVKCLEVSKFIFHRAAYWVEEFGKLSEDDKKSLKATNDMLQGFIEQSVGSKKWLEVTGVPLATMFDIEKPQSDVLLTAFQMKDLGIVSEVLPFSAERKNEMQANHEKYKLVAQSFGKNPILNKPQAQNNIVNKTDKKMTAEQLKQEFPELYASIVNEATAAERDRVGALNVYAQYDKELIAAKIKDGGRLTETEKAELDVKIAQSTRLAGLQANSQKPLQPHVPDDAPVAGAVTEELVTKNAEIASLADKMLPKNRKL